MPSYALSSRPIRGLAGSLVRFFIRGDLMDGGLETRCKAGVLQGWVSIVVNVLLFLIKGAVGLMLGSVAVLADAVHSISDVGSSTAVILGYRWARRPGDRKHPFGHGRFEFITALVLAFLLMLASVELARFGINRIMSPQPYTAPWWAIAVIAVTIGMKQWLAVFAKTLSEATGSVVLKADHWHHVTDAAGTSLVVAALVASRYELHGVDGWAGVAVACFVLYAGVDIARKAVSPLLGEAPGRNEVKRIEEASGRVHGVLGAHDIIVHKYGDTRVVSLHVEVDSGRSSMDVHDISERVEDEVERVMPCKAIVHVDPVDRSHPEYDRIKYLMTNLVRRQDELAEFHDLRVEGTANRVVVNVDVVARTGTDHGSYPDIRESVRRAIRDAVGGEIKDVCVTVETAYHDHHE